VRPINRRGLVVYGDISIDFHIRTSYHPETGQDARVEKVSFVPGGSAANCAAVAAHLGVPTAFMGFIGMDSFGEAIKEDLEKFGVLLTHLERIEGDTGIITAIINPQGERTFYSYRGVNSTGELSKLPENLFRNCKYLHISGYSFQDINSRNNSLLLIKEAKKFGTLVSLDPSFWHSKEYHKQNPSLLSDVNIIFPSQEEAELLSGSDDPSTAAQLLLEMGPQIVVITLGSEGCYLASAKQHHYLPAIPVHDVVDTTGAGDAFCAGFLAGQIFGLDIIDSAKMGNTVASIIIKQIGGHKGAPTLEQLCAVLINNHEEELADKILNINHPS
jgi:ribokinase